MVHVDEVNKQLRLLNAHLHFWNRPEARELPKILFEGEQLQHIVTGRYNGGFAVLCTTNLRVLLIDKKPFYLTLEDIRYDRITDVQLNHRLLDASIRLGSLTNTLIFTGYNPARLRELVNYIQEQVMVSRQNRATFHQQEQQYAEFLGSYTPQPQPQAPPIPAETVLQNTSTTTDPVSVNPYRAPVAVRRRVSRFY